MSLNNVFDNIDVLIDMYRKTMNGKYGEMIFEKNGEHKINFEHFKSYLEILSKEETDFYKKYHFFIIKKIFIFLYRRLRLRVIEHNYKKGWR